MMNREALHPATTFPITPNVVSRSPFICSFSFALKLPSPLAGHGHGSISAHVNISFLPWVMFYTVSYLPCEQGRVNTTPSGCCEHHIKKEEEWEGCAALLEEEAR